MSLFYEIFLLHIWGEPYKIKSDILDVFPDQKWTSKLEKWHKSACFEGVRWRNGSKSAKITFLCLL